MQTVADLVPKTGFFIDYLRWVTRLCDAPEIYHVGAALAAMSAVVGGRARGMLSVKLGDDVLVSNFPTNLWVLTVGPSTDRKSTASGDFRCSE